MDDEVSQSEMDNIMSSNEKHNTEKSKIDFVELIREQNKSSSPPQQQQ